MFLFVFAVLGTQAATGTGSVDFAAFVKALTDAGYTFDGSTHALAQNGKLTVKWSPVSGCYDKREGHECTVGNVAATANTPKRVNSGLTQFQLFEGESHAVNVKNVAFVYEPAAFTVCENSGWKGSFTAEQAPAGQIYLMNTGDVTFEGCTFDKVVLTSFNCTGTSTVKDCSFKNVYNSYAVKDIRGAKVAVTGCTFENCGAAVMVSSTVKVEEVTISGNTFKNVDVAGTTPDDKVGTRGLVQIASSGDYAETAFDFSGNTATDCGPVLRQLNTTVSFGTEEKAQLNTLASAGGSLYTTDSIKRVVAKVGETAYETLDEAIKAVQDGETIVVNAGEYKLNGSLTYTGKAFTIQAAEGAKVSFDMSAAVALHGAKITFSGVTFDYKTNGNYIGLQHTDTLVYNDCTVNGKVFLYAASETFTRCTFVQEVEDYNVWTYGAKSVTFNDCTFKNVGKTINAYIEGGNASSEPQKIEMADCTVESSKSNKAVVNIKNKTQAYDITLKGKNEVSGIAVNETTKSAWYQVETTDSTDQSCKAVSVTEVKDDGTKDVVYVVKPYVAAFVTVTGIAGFADRKYASFAEAYAAIKPTIEKLGLKQESATEDAFDALFTSVDANGNATLTYTISGTVVYDETVCTNLLTMGRKASHYGNGRHLINFKFVGATGKDTDTLTVNSNITLPYEWWSEKTTTGIHFENLTITGSAPSGLYPSQPFFEGIDFSVSKCALKGIKIYNCSNVEGSYTITDSVLDGTGAPADSYAIHLQGNEKAPLSINIKGNTISGYDRGINIDQKTAVAAIEGNTISVKDAGRSCIQLSSLATADIVGNTLELTGGNAITLHENLLTLSAAPEVSISDNKVTGTGYLVYDDAVANGKAFTSDNLKLTYATDNEVAEAVNTTQGVKGSKTYGISTAVNNEVQHYVATVGTSGYPSLAEAFAALSAEKHTLMLLNENAWDAETPVYWAAGTQSGYAATLTEALTAAYKANAGAITIVCRPSADVGTMTHGHVADDLTIYGNDAFISGGECDLEVDTYTFSRETGAQAADGVCLDKDITITAYELDNLGVWGERHTANKVTVNLTDCDGKALEGKTNVQRVYISGTRGVNDITLTDCDFLTKATAVYSNADGAIKAVNCSFTGGQVPFNINHKANGTQTVAVENCRFTNCGDAAGDWKQFAAPLRLVNSGTGTQSAEVTGCAFAGTVGANGDILLGDGRTDQASNDVELKVVNTAANIQAQKPGYYGGETVDATKKATAESPAEGTLETSVAKLLPVDPRTLGYATSGKAEALPATPDMNGAVVDVTAAQAQYVLDGAYGPIDGKTINFTESINDTLILGRASKYDGSKTVYRHGSHDGVALSYADFIAYKNQSGWTESCYYERTVENVTFTANEGVTVKNFEADGGAHIYAGAGTAPVYDYVRDTGSWVTEGSCYYKRAILKNITFKGLTFKAKTDINTSEPTTVYDGFTFKDCTFDLGTTADGNQAIRYYNENNNGNVKNLVVEGCTFKTCSQGVYTAHVKNVTVTGSTFDTTGHNAIAIQDHKGPCDHGKVVITGNTFKNIGDRIIRFNNVGMGTTVTITGNTADGNSGKLDEATGKREIVKATTLPVNAADSITASGNNWGADTVVEGVFIDDYATKLGTETCPYSREQFAAMTRAEYIAAQGRLGGTLYVNVGDYAYGTDGVLGNGVRDDTPGQVPDHSELNAYGENGYLGEKNDGANGHAVVFVGGTITSDVTGYTSIDSIGTSLLLAVPAYTKVTFKETTFKNVLSFDYQLYTSPWSQLGGLTFNGCTFDGIIVGAIASQELAFNGCTFNDYVNTTSANNSNPTWIRPAYGNWKKDDNEGQGTGFRSLTKITFENNTVTSTRPVKFERIAQWEMATTVTATGNTFAITPQEGDKDEKKTKNVGLYFGANAKFDLVVDKNKKSGETAALYTAVYSAPTGVTYAGLPAGSTVKNAAGEEVATEDALAWKTTDKITLKTTTEVASVTNATGVSVNFATLSEAVKAAQAGETVTLLADITLASKQSISKELTLDLNGKTLTGTAYQTLSLGSGANVTIQDSSAEKTGKVANGYKGRADPYTICLDGYSAAALTLVSGTVEANPHKTDLQSVAINTNHEKDGPYAINIKGGKVFVPESSTNGRAIVAGKNVTLTVEGGEIVGGLHGVDVYDGSKTAITGGSISARVVDPGKAAYGLRATGTAIVTIGAADGTADDVSVAGIMMNDNGYKLDVPAVTVNSGTIAGPVYSITPGTIVFNVQATSEDVLRFADDTAAKFLPSNLELRAKDIDGKTMYYVAAKPVAAIGAIGYETLEAALAAAKDGETVKLLADVTVAGQLVAEKALTLDLGGKTVTSTYAIPASLSSGEGRYALLTKAPVTVTNGTFVAGQARALGAYANLTLTDATVTSELTGGHCCVAFCAAGGTYTVANATIKGDYAIANFAHNATIAITGSALEGSGCGLYHNGSNYGLKLTATDTTINGAIDQTLGAGKDPSGVYLSGSSAAIANAANQNGAHGRHQATFTRCTIKGNTGVEVKYTDLTLEDCTVVATTKEPSYTQNNNGMAALGFAVVSTDNATGNATPKPEGTITITGVDGSYTGLVGLGSLDSVKTGFADFDDAHYAVSGGTFSNAVLPEYCAAGFIPTANDDGTYGVKEGAYVAEIGTVKYETVDAAMEAAAANETATTVKLLAESVDETVVPTWYIKGDVTVDADSAVKATFAPIENAADAPDTDGMAYIASDDAEKARTITVGEKVTLSFPNTAKETGAFYIGYGKDGNWAPTHLVLNGRIEAYEPYIGAGSSLTVSKTGSLKSLSECLLMRRGSTVTVTGTDGAWSAEKPQVALGYGSQQGGEVTFKDTFVTGGAFWTMWNRNGNADVATKLTLDNTAFTAGAFKGTASSGETSAYQVELKNGAKMTIAGDFAVIAEGAVTIEAGSLIIAKSIANAGTFIVDATGITAPVKVFDYTGTVEMTLADYGTVNVVGGEAYVEDGDLWVRELPVAKIGETVYGSLADAVVAAQGGDTVTLLTDVALTEALTLDKDLTLDLGGKTVTAGAVKTTRLSNDGCYAGFVVNGSAQVAVKNGTLTSDYATYKDGTTSASYSSYVVLVDDTAHLTLDGVRVVGQDAGDNYVRASGGICYDSTGSLALKSCTVSAGASNGRGYNYNNPAAIFTVSGCDGTLVVDATTVTGGAATGIKMDKDASAAINVNGGVDVTVSNGSKLVGGGSAKTSGNALEARGSGTLKVSDSTLQGGSSTDGIGGSALYVTSSTVTAEVTGATLVGGDGGTSWDGSGVVLNKAATVTITDSTVKSGRGENATGNAAAITLPNWESADLTLSNVSLSGSDRNTVIKNGLTDGIKLAGDVTVDAGTLKNVAISELGENVSIMISEGAAAEEDTIVSLDPDRALVKDSDVLFRSGMAVAQVVDSQDNKMSYATLASAIAAAKDGETVKLLADVTESVTIAADRTLTLDLNGKTLSAGKASEALTVTGHLTIDDTSAAKSGRVVGDGRYAVYMKNRTAHVGEAAVGGSLTLNAGSLEGATHGVYILANQAAFTMNGGKVSATQAESIRVNNDYHAKTISLLSGEVGDVFLGSISSTELTTLTVGKADQTDPAAVKVGKIGLQYNRGLFRLELYNGLVGELPEIGPSCTATYTALGMLVKSDANCPLGKVFEAIDYNGETWYRIAALQKIAITFDDSKTAALPFATDWLKAHVGKGEATWTTEALEADAANGLKKWQCYLFGLDPSKEDAKVVATAGQGTDEAIPLTVANADASASPLVTGGYVTVAYVLMGSNDGTAWTKVATSDKRDGLKIPLTGTTYKFYRVDVTVTSAEGN